jgi:hypothetical protein
MTGIGRRVRQRYIARDGNDRDDLHLLRRSEGQQQSHGVVLSGIGVDDDFARRQIVTVAFRS